MSLLFQWGVSYHELAAERVFMGKKKQQRASKIDPKALKQAYFSKGAKQLFKDYLHQTGFNTEPVLITYPDNLELNK